METPLEDHVGPIGRAGRIRTFDPMHMGGSQKGDPGSIRDSDPMGGSGWMHGMEGHGMGNGNVVAADSHIESSCLNRKEK